MINNILEMKNIQKSFGGVHALKNVSFNLKKGEIHALVGENGAGKSTLIKILAGALNKDSGKILLDGKEVDVNNPHKGKELGIGVIYQELMLAPDITVAENIFIDELAKNSFFIQWSELYENANKIINKLGFDINSKKRVGDLTIAYQQIVEICKALKNDVKILVLDEPTAVLAPAETERLFNMLNELKKNGVSIIYISHRLEEIFKITDRITVMRDGIVTGTVLSNEVTENELIKLMIGRNLDSLIPERVSKIGKEALRVENLSNDKIKDINFNVKYGEVLGFSGLLGSGRTETLRAVFGADPIDSGEIILDGKKVEIKSPKQAVKNGIAYVPEDRKNHGAILDMPIRQNITLSKLQKILKRFGFIDFPKENQIVKELISKLLIKTKNTNNPVSSLSGGNQQKVVLAKWFNADSNVMIFDEPTRGVDVGAKVEIYNVINELASNGIAVIVISSELIEIIGLCDRVLVMKEGRIKGEINKKELSEESIMKLAVGGN